MRELKFRVWDKTKNVMIYKPCWIAFNTKTIVFGDGYAMGFNEIELMQFTGLTECTGKEIYEGDILKFQPVTNPSFPISKDKMQMGEVKYHVNSAKFKVGHYWGFGEVYLTNLEVIGDIYRNPELLSEKTEVKLNAK